jgi:hypothetical protein
MTAVTNTPLSLSYFIADITTALATFNRLRWYRGLAEVGPFEAITGAAATAASLVSSRGEPFDVQGLAVKFKVNGGAERTVTFTGVSALTAAQVVSQIQGTYVDFTAAVVGTGVSLTTVATGSAASLELTGGDALPYLGFLLGATSVGLDADTTLSAGVHEYFHTDSQSSVDYWYRTEMRSSLSAVVAPMSPAVKVQRPARIPDAQTIVCYLRLADMKGAAIAGRGITIANVFSPNVAAGYGIFRHYEQGETDADGYFEMRLLRGMLIDLVIDGTSFVRRIQIPTVGDSVNLLDPALVTQDEFGIQEPNIDAAIRLS